MSIKMADDGLRWPSCDCLAYEEHLVPCALCSNTRAINVAGPGTHSQSIPLPYRCCIDRGTWCCIRFYSCRMQIQEAGTRDVLVIKEIKLSNYANGYSGPWQIANLSNYAFARIAPVA